MGLLPGNEGSSFEKIQEWLVKEIKLLRGRDPSGFEVVLFSDMGEAKSTRLEELCRQYGVRRETTTGLTSSQCIRREMVSYKCRDVQMSNATV